MERKGKRELSAGGRKQAMNFESKAIIFNAERRGVGLGKYSRKKEWHEMVLYL